MSETSIKIELALVDRTASKALDNFIGKSVNAEKSLEKLKKSGKGTFEEITVGIGKSLGVMDIFVGNLLANVAVKGFEALTGAASALFQTFITDGVESAIEAQDAINSLNTALAQSGIYSKDTSQNIQDFASELQSTTTIADDVILKNAALIQSMGQLDQEGLKRATAAAVNLSAALDKDLGTASEALGKAASGNVTSLQKMGIEIQKGRDDAETFANALAAVEARFSDAASSKVNTFSGAVGQAKNSFGDLTEEIGNLIVKNPVFIEVIKKASEIMTGFTTSVKGAAPSLKDDLGQAFVATLNTFAAFAQTVDQINRQILFSFGSVVTGLSAVAGAIDYVITLGGNLTDHDPFEDLKKNLDWMDEVENGKSVLGDTAKALNDLATAGEQGLQKLSAGADGTVAPLNNAKGAVRELSEEQKKAQDQLRAFAEDLVKQANSDKAQAEGRLATAKALSDSELQILNEQLEARLISVDEFNARRAEINAQYDAVQLEIENQRFLDEQARLQAAFDQKLISENQYNSAREQLAKNSQVQTDKRNAEILKRDGQIKKQLLDQEKAYNQSKIQATADVFGALASVAALGGKKNFLAVKAFQLAEATTSMYLAIAKANALGPPMNVPAMVSASVTGAAQIARIVSSKPPSFEDGGIVPGTSFTGDNIAARVNSGEMVLTRSQQGKLFQIANGAGGGESLAEIAGLLRMLVGRDDRIILNVGGRTIAEVLRSELASGRTFA